MVSFAQHVSDFANLFKAFIGSNYLTMSFAFSQSGIVLGIVLLIFISAATDYCCGLIVTNKKIIIQSVLRKYLEDEAQDADSSYEYGSVDDSDAEPSLHDFPDDKETLCRSTDGNSTEGKPSQQTSQLLSYMNCHLGLSDIGHFAFGKVGSVWVSCCLFLTQFGFCTNYFIFIGNTLKQCFPLYNVSEDGNQTILSPLILPINNSDDWEPSPDNLDVRNWTSLNTWHIESSSPNLIFLVLSPLPIFLIFSLIRSIRKMGFISIIADLSIFCGIITVLLYILLNFKLRDIVYAKLDTLPIYIGMVSVAFEGIGTVIPIEASMEGNRHNFRLFLRLSILLLTVILSLFGIIGYLRYGSDTRQIIVLNIPSGSIYTLVIDITLMIGVIFTFPLQIYPVIEMMENLVFSQSSSSGQDYEPLMAQDYSDIPYVHTISKIPDNTSTWKRNLLRIIIVLFQLAIAVLMRDNFAYFNSFIGAVGSCFLAYILPTAVHLKLTWHKSGMFFTRANNFMIAVFGLVSSVVGLYVTVVTIVKNLIL